MDRADMMEHLRIRPKHLWPTHRMPSGILLRIPLLRTRLETNNSSSGLHSDALLHMPLIFTDSQLDLAVLQNSCMYFCHLQMFNRKLFCMMPTSGTRTNLLSEIYKSEKFKLTNQHDLFWQAMELVRIFYVQY